MASLKEKINYITNQFEAGKPAITGEPSNEFLMSVINELSADESNYAEFKDSIPAIHKAAMEELNVASNDSKHLLVSNMLRNSGISTTLKEENVTQKPIFVEFLVEKAIKEGNDVLNKDISELMAHAFDEKNKRIEISSLLAITHTCATQAKFAPNSVLGRYVSSDNFSGAEYAKFCGATLAFSKLKDSFDYDLTENQENSLAVSVEIIERFKVKSSKDPESDVHNDINKAEQKYSKSFFSNDLDVEAQLHKVRSEESLSESAGMISGYDLGSPVKENLKEQEQNKADEAKFDLMMDWEERYNNYLKKLTNVRVMTAGDKFKKRFDHHGFAPSTANLFGDSIVTCDKFGDPKITLWNISSLTGTMKLSREVRYDDPASCQQAFTIAALNARRQGWNKVFLNHPGPDQEAKVFIEQSFDAMVKIGDYSFDQIKVPRRYQHVLDYLVLQALTGSIKNDANVTDELRNAEAIHKEDPKEDAPDAPEQNAANPAAKAPATPADNSTRDSDSIQNQRDAEQDNNPDTVIPNTFEDDKLAFDIPTKDDEAAPAPELDDFETARLAEIEAAKDHDNHFDDSHLADDRFVQDDQSYSPPHDEAEFHSNNFDQSGEITYTLPDELKNDQQASIESEATPEKPTSTRKIKFKS